MVKRSRTASWWRTLAVMVGVVTLTLAHSSPAAAAVVSAERWYGASNSNGVNCNYTSASLEGGAAGSALQISILNRSHYYDRIDTPPFLGCEATPGGAYHTSHPVTWALYWWNPITERWQVCDRADDLTVHNTWQYPLSQAYPIIPCGSGHYFLRVVAKHFMVTIDGSEWVGGQTQTDALHVP